MQSKVGLEAGELVVGESLLIAVALTAFLLQGMERSVNVSTIWLYGAAVLVMLFGYVFSDLFAMTDPAQYLRGWARVAVLGLDILSLLIIVSRGQRHLWWFALGLASGILVDLLADSTPFAMLSWKQGYGFASALLCALLAGFWERMGRILAFAGLGVLSVLLDYRGLGGVLIVAAGILLVQARGDGLRRQWLIRAMLLAAALLAASTLLGITMLQSDSRIELRRQESNLGRYVGMAVAARAVAESPLIGYGSWAGDKRYVAMLNQELARVAAGTKTRFKRTDSILPHSQLLQAWVEGGLLGALFFVLYGWQLLLALRWLVLRHLPGRLTPLYLLLVVFGLWNLAASPFLGTHRINIASAVAALALLARERTVPINANSRSRKAGVLHSA